MVMGLINSHSSATETVIQVKLESHFATPKLRVLAALSIPSLADPTRQHNHPCVHTTLLCCVGSGKGRGDCMVC